MSKKGPIMLINYTVVKNEQEQYSIWPTGKDLPAGWLDTGISGDKEHCLSHIKSVWTDIRPLSVRQAAGEA